MLLTDKYADKIYGTLTCYDRMIIQGYIPGWSYAEGMTSYLHANGIRIFDYLNFSQPFTEQVRQNAQLIADENGIEIEFPLNSTHFGKMTVSRKSSPKPVRQNGSFISFLPWNNVILTNLGMINQPVRHS